MPTNRVDRMLAGLDLGGNARESLDTLRVACAAEFGVTGAGAALVVGGAHRDTEPP